ncbi:hypothetical protein NLG97_g1683 [Lecanicillium saksenae]|uniref:Uncharacterized protein n=1 Tax=Lecanicillium saksenae TaxID=468837 RepID=A0ACC1R4X9_9HYPO|nr:hypothetical protein NLG97_g1683 [Lecanicillium saksenae]
MELNAEHALTSDRDLLVDAPASSEYPDLNYTDSLWHTEDQAVKLDNEGSSFNGEYLLDLDLDFPNLFYPSSQSSGSCENINTIFPTCSSSALSPKTTESLAMELTKEDGYGDGMVGRDINQGIAEDDAAMQFLIHDTSSGDSQYENSPFSDDLNVATFCVTDVMHGLTEEAGPPSGNASANSSVAKVVLLVEDCDADTVKSLIDLTRRLHGKAKMTITV